ncbi:hypothetical protein CTI14_44715, partial [Methylobacterium radiotolerans]
YSKPGCRPCEIAKANLEALAFAFEVVNIESAPERRAGRRDLRHGGRADRCCAPSPPPGTCSARQTCTRPCRR